MELKPRPFRNNLVQNDRVFDTVSTRQGKVSRTPKNDQNRMTCILFDGTQSEKYVDVMQLRLIVDGRTPEDVPPIDGEPPADGQPRPARTPAAPRFAGASDDPALNLEAEIKLIDVRQAEITAEFKGLTARKEKFTKALEVLRS